MALRNLFNRFQPFSRNQTISAARNMADTPPPPVKVVSFQTANDPKTLLVDVREPSELKEDGKIPNSVNVPLGEVGDAFKMESSKFESKYGVMKPGAETDFVISCRSGKRATNAYHVLRGLGYQNVSVYTGSFLDWVKNGGAVEK